MGRNLEFLKIQRDVEYEEIKRLLRPAAKILENGSGAGFQTKLFSGDGFVVGGYRYDFLKLRD